VLPVVRIMEMKFDFCGAIERLFWFEESLGEFQFAPGWDRECLSRRISKIHSEVFSGWMSEPCPRDLNIAKDAARLTKNLRLLGGVEPEFLRKLRCLARIAPVRSGRGGDRRSGKRNQRQIVLQEAVRLYLDSHEDPGYSANGPLFHFVNGLREAILGADSTPYTTASVGAEFGRWRVRRRSKQTE
jgi:hypothetical protein